MKPYSFRKLGSQDLFLMCKIVGKIGINEFTACFERESVQNMIRQMTENPNENANSIVGMSIILEIANVIVSKLPQCETEIYEMLENVSDQSMEDLKDMDMVTFVEMIVDFIKKDEFRDFIQVVSKLLNMGN